MSDYETVRGLVAAWGTLYFAAMFAIALAYAFWPSRKREFEDAASIPLKED